MDWVTWTWNSISRPCRACQPARPWTPASRPKLGLGYYFALNHFGAPPLVSDTQVPRTLP